MRQLSLNAKMGSVISVLVVGNIAIAVMAFDKMSDINRSLAEITSVSVPRMSLGFALRDIMRRLAIAERTLIAEDSKSGIEKTSRELSDLSEAFLKNFAEADRNSTVKGKEHLIK